MLHGYTQSGPLFAIKTKALLKSLQKAFPPSPNASHLPDYAGGIELHYPTAPINLNVADIPGFLSTTTTSNTSSSNDSNDDDADLRSEAYGWWVRKGDSEPFLYDGLEQSLSHLAQILQTQGPFEGVIGFSQGGALAGMLASLLEPGRREAFGAAQSAGGMAYPDSFLKQEGGGLVHPALKFAVSYSGFAAAESNTLYRGFYEPRIQTPLCHFIGSLDTVVEEERSLRLVRACDEGGKGKVGRVVYHPGGHFLPSSQKAYVGALVEFMKEVSLRKGQGRDVGEKGRVGVERVKDMDVPF